MECPEKRVMGCVGDSKLLNSERFMATLDCCKVNCSLDYGFIPSRWRGLETPDYGSVYQNRGLIDPEVAVSLKWKTRPEEGS